MNLASAIELHQITAGGPGSGCHGPNCGRPEGSHSDSTSYAKKLGGVESEARNVLATISTLDQRIAPFLNTHPLRNVSVAKNPSRDPALRSGQQGAYYVAKASIVLQPVRSLERNAALFDEDSVFGAKTAPGDYAKQQAIAFAHELGHHVWETVDKAAGLPFRKSVTIDAFMADDKKISQYATTHFREYFAESFAAYHYNRALLSPVALRMVETVIAKAHQLGKEGD